MRGKDVLGRLVAVAGTLVCMQMVHGQDWQLADTPLKTPWTDQVTPERVHAEYPRPQFVRDQWQNLNGLWQYAVTDKGAARPSFGQDQILVPFPIESALSGVKEKVGPEKELWYRRTFSLAEIADASIGSRLRLHFGAVDWRAEVYVNGQQVGTHLGGYDPFWFDVTDALRPNGSQELVVRVWDPTDKGVQPRGKQVIDPRGIWYTSVTGIWQTVWLEPVPETRIESLQITPDVDRSQVDLQVGLQMRSGRQRLAVRLLDGDRVVQASSLTVDAGAGGPGSVTLVLPVPKPRLWSPGDPHLYDLQLELTAGAVRDQVRSYFGMRKIELGKDAAGYNRLMLNGEPVFSFGLLDQGWWPDGLYTAPTDEALRYDIEMTRKMGFNTARKHVKVEPARWYYWCDKLGLMVWQDMPNGDKHIGPDDPDLERTPQSEATYRREYEALIRSHYNHPSIIAWVPFNEGWGQFKTNEILRWAKELDPTRLIDGPSGWADRGAGDMHDAHRYPGPSMPDPESDRAAVLGEFGGLGLPLPGHLWWNKRNWGYRTYTTRAELLQHYTELIEKLLPLIPRGLAAAVYTQTTDVEGEVNGLMTYDRRVVKLDPEQLTKLHRPLFEPRPAVLARMILPTSERVGQTWHVTFEQPEDQWVAGDFDDASWRQAKGGFGTPGTPGARIGTRWTSSDIWIRRSFELSGGVEWNDPQLRIHHDEDAEVYLDGQLIAKLDGYTTGYELIRLPEGARKLLTTGRHVLAVHCHQTAGGQYIDVGLVDWKPVPAELPTDTQRRK